MHARTQSRDRARLQYLTWWFGLSYGIIQIHFFLIWIMAALIKGFRTFEQPPPVTQLLENEEANLRIPWWRRGGMGIFEHGALLSEFVPAIVLQRALFYADASWLSASLAGAGTFACLAEGG